MSLRKKYAVVLGVDVASAQAYLTPYIVASAWLRDNNTVVWFPPNKLGPTFIENIIEHGSDTIVPDESTWKKFAVTVKKSCETYAKAKEALRVALAEESENDTAKLKDLKKRQGMINSGRKSCESELYLNYIDFICKLIYIIW